MGMFELFMIALGLSADAFAVSVCKGLGMKRLDLRYALTAAAFFGGFQALMPFLGWVLGKRFERYITSVDHWIAFALLAFIGGKMLVEAVRGKNGSGSGEVRFDIRELLLLSVATSIDALAVGVSFAFLRVSILPSAAAIGCTTFLLSLAGVVFGNRVGGRLAKNAEAAGGIILILIGSKILLEHLGVL